MKSVECVYIYVSEFTIRFKRLCTGGLYTGGPHEKTKFVPNVSRVSVEHSRTRLRHLAEDK